MGEGGEFADIQPQRWSGLGILDDLFRQTPEVLFWGTLECPGGHAQCGADHSGVGSETRCIGSCCGRPLRKPRLALAGSDFEQSRRRATTRKKAGLMIS